MMKTTAFALAALLALSGTATANDFGAPISPDKGPSAQVTERKPLDRMSTHSIVRGDVRRHADPKLRKAGEPTLDRGGSGIEINPWIVPSFR
jgi:hypothetical protein